MSALQSIASEAAAGTAACGVSTRTATVEAVGPVDEVFPLASVTKLLSALAVLVAVQDGVLHLDEPAGPDGATVRHLLAHASGLPMSEGGLGGDVGDRRIYSNVGFEVLGALVEKRLGMDFSDHLELEVLEPLAMDDTWLDGSPAHAGQGTVEDLLRFGRELLAPTLLEPGLFDQATTVAFPGLAGVLPGFGRQDPNDWGLGFELRDGKDPHWTGSRNSPATFGHFGQSGSFLWVDPEHGLACAYLGERDFGDWAKELWPALSDRVVAAHAAART